jgi:hypothetical protein
VIPGQKHKSIFTTNSADNTDESKRLQKGCSKPEGFPDHSPTIRATQIAHILQLKNHRLRRCTAVESLSPPKKRQTSFCGNRPRRVYNRAV